MNDVFIYISTKQGGHGCRIKAFKGKYSKKEFIVTIPECKIVTDTKTIPNDIKKQILQFAIKNAYELEKYWNGYYSDVKRMEELDVMLSNIKLNKTDLEISRSITLSDRKK